MCGIIGYLGNKPAVPILLQGLKNLEYRGYDSAGVAIIDQQSLKVVKCQGRIVELERALGRQDSPGTLGIAHTRWATHGEPNQANAHPHFDCQQKIAIVHNGIVENYQSLKTFLTAEGHHFVSETDSEVLAHLIEKFYQGDLAEAAVKALKLVEGSYGLAILHQAEEKIVVARKGSPLIIGLGAGEMLVASDAAALLPSTNKVIYLNDGELAILTKDSYQVKSIEGSRLVNKEIEEIKWNVEQLEKKGYKHFMLKEIMEQPQSLKETLAGRLKDGRVKISVNFKPLAINRIVIAACGTSWHSALIGKYLLESLAKIPVEVDYASEFRYRDPLVTEKDLVMVISQSGETADTLAALRQARLKGALTLGIINVVGSTIAREVDSGIYLYAGPEIGVASTKAFTSQVTALLLTSLFIRQRKDLPLNQELLKELANLPEKIKETLKSEKVIKEIAQKFYTVKNFLYLGRGLNFPVALEGALKLKEISYIHAEGYPAAEIKHGPIALIDQNMPVVFIATQNSLSEKTLSNMQEVKARQGTIIAVVNQSSPELRKLSHYLIEVPAVPEELSPLINIIPLQLLAYYIADLKGLDVDKPRNLAKSVTVE